MLAMPPNAHADIRARVLSHLMRTLLHEVNNSLTAISLAAELALRKQDATASEAALQKAVSMSQAQRGQLDTAALLLSEPETQGVARAVPMAELVTELSGLCSLACRHQIIMDDQTDGLSVLCHPAEMALLVTACLLDGCVTEGDMVVQLRIDPQDDHYLLMTLSADGLRQGALFDPGDRPVADLIALAKAASCTLMWQPGGTLSGLRVALDHL